MLAQAMQLSPGLTISVWRSSAKGCDRPERLGGAPPRTLGIRVTTDGAAIVDEDGQSHPLVAIIPDFGGGMYEFEVDDRRLSQLARERAHGYTSWDIGETQRTTGFAGSIS